MPDIILTNGMLTTVDSDDLSDLSQYRWHCLLPSRVGKTAYAYAWIPYPNAVMMHRHLMHLDVGDSEHVHHKDEDGLNNQRSNLEVVTVSQHLSMQGPRGLTSEFKGVHWENNRWKWKAMIHVNGKDIFLGRYDDEVEAALTYDQAVRKFRTDHAYLNFPGEDK